MSTHPSAPKPSDALRERALNAILFVVATTGALFLGQWLGVGPDNDGYARLARALSHPEWLRETSTKPLEMLLAAIVARGPTAALWGWRLLGALHLGALCVLAYRLTGRLLPSARAPALIAALITPASPLLLQHFLAFNSVATLSVAILFWCDRELAGCRAGALSALALVALSRVEGALFVAPFLALASAGLSDKQKQTRSLLESFGVLLACALVWLLLDRLAHGYWLGVLRTTTTYMRAAGTKTFGPTEIPFWLSGGWLTHLGKPVALSILAGCFSLWRSGARRQLIITLTPLLAGQMGLALLGLLGKPIFYRFLVAYFPLGILLAIAGTVWVAQGLAGRWIPWRAAALALAVAAAFSTYLWRLSALDSAQHYLHKRWRESQAALLCLAPEIVATERPIVVVTDRLMGPVAYGLRESPIRELTYEREFATRQPPIPSKGILWLHDSTTEQPGMLETLAPTGDSRGCPDEYGLLRLYRFDPAKDAHALP